MKQLACLAALAGCTLERGTGLIELTSEQHTDITEGEGAASFVAQHVAVMPAAGFALHPGPVVGPCTVFSSHGDLDVSDGGRVDAFIDVRPISFDTSFSHDQPLWRGGETLDITTAGGDAPPIHGTLIAPHAGTVTQPSPPGATPIHVARGTDIGLAWRDVVADDVAILVDTLDAANHEWSMSCVFDAAAGTATIPAAALALVPAPTAGLYIHVETSTTITARNYDITLRATSHPSWPDGREAGFSIVLD